MEAGLSSAQSMSANTGAAAATPGTAAMAVCISSGRLLIRTSGELLRTTETSVLRLANIMCIVTPKLSARDTSDTKADTPMAIPSAVSKLRDRLRTKPRRMRRK